MIVFLLGVLGVIVVFLAIYFFNPRNSLFRMYASIVRANASDEAIREYFDFYFFANSALQQRFGDFMLAMKQELAKRECNAELTYKIVQHILYYEPLVIVNRHDAAYALDAGQSRHILDAQFKPIRPVRPRD